MARFRKKPVEIEAVQVKGTDYNGHRGCDHEKRPCTAWDGPPFSELPQWLQDAVFEGRLIDHNRGSTDYAQWDIETSEGTMTARPGDWIIRGVKGELYPCKPDIFKATYDPAD